MNKQGIVWAVAALIVLTGVGIVLLNNGNNADTNTSQNDQHTTLEQQMKDGERGTTDSTTSEVNLQSFPYSISAELEDVTDGQVGTINTNGEAEGTAQAGFSDGTYAMLAIIDNLPEPKDGEFYEGWIVRPEPFKFISTGKLEFSNGAWVNAFTSSEDLTGFVNYVLTIEPDDGDPAPAGHVVEGRMAQQ